MQFLRTPKPEPPSPGTALGTTGFYELSMYKEPPAGEVALEEFEKIALDRLRILKSLEESKLRSKSDEVIQDEIKALLTKHKLRGSGAARVEAERRDVISHFILRLAYCRSADLRSWYLGQEAALFKARFRDLAPAEQVEFFRAQGLPYQAIDSAEFEELKDALAQVAASVGDAAASASIQQGGRTLFFKVPFMAVPDLVGSRRVLLRGGVAFVAQEQVYSLVVGAFRAHLSAALAELAQRWGAFVASEGGRLAPLVESMPTRSLSSGEGRKLPGGEITAAQVHQIAAARHLPPCMALMYDRLSSEHHLKHYGLQQMSLFLKHVGLPLEQALLFWRAMFSPRTQGEKFNREYAYNIRYNYAQEGKRTDWSEWGCVRIIQRETGPCSGAGDCNGGCPFKTLEEAKLRALLGRLQCGERFVNDAVAKARGKHYQLACAMAFEGIAGVPHDTGINKPSDYYAAAVEAAAPKGANGVKAEPGAGVAATPAHGGGGGGGGGGVPATPATGAASAAAAAAATPAVRGGGFGGGNGVTPHSVPKFSV
ncbi:DNA primase large subunit-like [Raphidocelis subcapitata]|uniref:DNA primase large subunit-like n=1 Tax=Raphidocelis subcapitata TaxID=307507 RepID=A0A2V0P113_9CHLO|nr:DNA primase large subunit-like [Raphidocelis subcapitata]|eukprot:GBF91520.1 DNA primase large subunit-like [Raphidocelis subcapitata]